MSPSAAAGRLSLDWLAESQSGVVTRQQLREHGFDSAAVRTQIAGRRWQRAGRGVVVLHNGPLTPRQLRWVAVLSHHSAALAGIDGGADSFGEIDLGRLARRAGLAPPRRQVFRLDRAGRRRFLDADLDGFSVEVDGAVHLRPFNYWDDMERQNDLIVVTGKPILRFSTVAIRLSPETVVAQLAAAARRFGRCG